MANYELVGLLEDAPLGTLLAPGAGDIGTVTSIAASVGIYLGGTAAANLLDDYEEGTWTPTPSSGTFSIGLGTYVKVGNMVTAFFDIVVGTGGATFMTSPIASSITQANAVFTTNQDFAGTTTCPVVVIAGSEIYFRSVGDSSAFQNMPLTASAGITGFITYQVA